MRYASGIVLNNSAGRFIPPDTSQPMTVSLLLPDSVGSLKAPGSHGGVCVDQNIGKEFRPGSRDPTTTDQPGTLILNDGVNRQNRLYVPLITVDFTIPASYTQI